MKLIQALKQTKDLKRKSADLRKKISQYCADMDFEAPTYGSVEMQRKEVSGWLQACEDIHKEILRLNIAIQRTNLETETTIELDGKYITKSIAEWIHRRRELAGLDTQAWQALSSRGLKDGRTKTTAGSEIEMKVRLYFDPKQRDNKLNALLSEPSIIDGHLEVVNAITDLIE